ncbi:MAG: protoheme IX farnesyltransferase [Rhodocyclaceae bacterium]|nr:protoheme IX farnesyltransferase [Rhodocyclaceae bacterium]
MTAPAAIPVWRAVISIFKLRIGLVIALTALAGLAISPSPAPGAWQIVVLFFAVLVSSASAGAFNQYYEADLDPLMQRTRQRVFASGTFARSPAWLAAILILLALSVAAAWWALNVWVALYTFLGAFFYGVVYTVWLKRRSWMNIVIGGLAGSWAVLAGAAAADPSLGAAPLALAWILFLWTPPHFWSLAMVCRDDYEAAKVPMLPVVVGDERAARIIFFSTVALVFSAFIPLAYGMGAVYFLAAASGGGFFLYRAWQLMRDPTKERALKCFLSSLVQLSLLLIATLLEVIW